MFPSRITPSASHSQPIEQGESSQRPSSPSASAAQQIAQHLQQISGQKRTFEATLGDGAQPVQHIRTEQTRERALSTVLNAWVDQLHPSEKKEGQKLASGLLKRKSNAKTMTLNVSIGRTFPDIFPFFTGLETLNLTLTHREIPESLGSLKNLSSLNLNAHTLQALPKSLAQLPKLSSLVLQNIRELPPLPLSAGGLRNLKSLNTISCSGENALPANTHLLPNLEQVYLSRCNALGDALQQLQACKHLKKLAFHQTPISTEQFYQIKALKALSSLNISSLRLLTQLPEDLFPMPNLTAFSLEHSGLVQIPESISRQTNLKTLSVGANYSLTSLPESIHQLRQLRALDVTGCSSLTHLPANLSDLPSACQIQMENTGLSSTLLLDFSRQTELRRQSSNGRCGPTVHFSLPASATRPVRTLQEEALEWMREAGNNNGLHPVAQEHIAQLDTDSAKALATLLVRFKHTAQYKLAPKNTAQRIHAMLNELFAYPKLLDSFCAMALESTTTCDDRTALGMLHMELALLENRLVRAIPNQLSKAQALNAIKQIGLGVFKQKHLMDFAHEHAKQAKGFVDETEIVLKFLTKLGKKLALPTQLDHMLYARLAWQVKPEDLEKAEHQITEQANLDHPAFLDFLASWHPMQEALQKHFSGLWRDLEHQCDNIDTEALEALEDLHTRYQAASAQHGEESPQALDWKAKINQTNETRQTKRAAVWRAAIQDALNAPAEDNQAGPSKKQKLDPSV